MARADKDWKGSTYGSVLMHKWLIASLKYMDVRLLYIFESLFIIPFCLVLNRSGRTAYRYFRERHHYSPLHALWSDYVNHCLFGQVVIDRFAMYAGRKFDVEIEGYDNYLRLASGDEGFMQLSAHVGNYEIAGYTLHAETKPFNSLVFGGEKSSVMENRNKMFASTNIRMISIKSDMSHVFDINKALDNGEIVSMPADRVIGSKKVITKTFLGAKADFPAGPFAVPVMRGLDVLAVNVMKTAPLKYKIYVTPLVYDKTATRKQQTEQLSTAYVSELERMMKTYPSQWYNFYDFWNR